MPPWDASASVTAGLKCAPEIGPNVRMSTTSAAPVAIAFARRAIATLPAARRSPMMPEPTTAARSIAVPTASAAIRRERSIEQTQLQQRGPQHEAPAGLIARMNPLMLALGRDELIDLELFKVVRKRGAGKCRSLFGSR